jgi:hypothetical protein
MKTSACAILGNMTPRVAVYRERALIPFEYSADSPSLDYVNPLDLYSRPDLRYYLRELYGSGSVYLDHHEYFCFQMLKDHPSCDIQEEIKHILDYRVEHKPVKEKQDEIRRVLRERQCPYCATQMNPIPYFGPSMVLCPTCGYWLGRGTRGHGPANCVGVMSTVHKADLNSVDLSFPELVGHLRQLPDHLLQLSPRRAEQVVMDLLREVLNCEVRPMGGITEFRII